MMSPPGLLLSLSMKICLLILTLCCRSLNGEIDLSQTLACYRRDYTYDVKKADSKGRKCWDSITVWACWGRCDSSEFADWQFPFKVSHHMVCIHDEQVLKTVQLKNCDPDVDPKMQKYTYHDSKTCSCKVCSSKGMNCDHIN